MCLSAAPDHKKRTRLRPQNAENIHMKRGEKSENEYVTVRTECMHKQRYIHSALQDDALDLALPDARARKNTI